MSELTLVPIKVEEINKIESKEIRERAELGYTEKTKLYMAMQSAQEVGFLSVDLHLKDFFVYEIFIPRAHRRKQIGTYLLGQAERIASEYGYLCVLLKPHPLDTDLKLADLISWYARHGYVHANPEFMLKRLGI
jgi:GNAT superfamily N-acetyltransferase